MAFQKFAKLDVLEVKSAPNRVRTASLSRLSDFNKYRTDDGYLYVRVRAISSRVNKNHDGWPADELKKSYATFIGKPIFVDHHNSDPKKARGVIVDAALHIEDQHTAALDPYYAHAPQEHLPPTWIELLLEVDAKRFPKLAKAIVNGDIDGVSMGANVERSICSHCKNEAFSPDQYCSHVRSKGAYFDYIDRNGQKTSKKSYEDCYDIGFFEISFVFDPADETALVKDIRKSKVAHAVRHEADQHPEPQAEMFSAPEKVDTLRQDQVCPICGSDMEDGVCEVCNYEEPPEGFDNPDLDKAKQVDEQMRDQDAQQAAQGQDAQTPNDVVPGPDQQPQPMPSGAMPAQASTANTSASHGVINEKTSANQGRINTQERPILPVTRKVTDKPMNPKTVQDSSKPVESNTRKETMSTQTQKIADGATPQGDGVQADKRVDVEGVGGVSGDPLSGIKHENVEKSMEQKGGPATDTWSGNKGDSLGQHDPVSGEERTDQDLGGPIGSPVSHTVTADASNDVGGPIGEAVGDGGSAKGGISTWDASDGGFPDHDPARVDLNAPLKEEVGAGTETDSSEEFRSLKHADPVTNENGNDVGGPMGTAIKAPLSSFQAATNAMRLAETEIDLGVIRPEAKWDRIAELEDEDPAVVVAELRAYAKVKTARTAKSQTKTAGATRMPSLQPMTHVAGFDADSFAPSAEDINVEDSLY